MPMQSEIDAIIDGLIGEYLERLPEYPIIFPLMKHVLECRGKRMRPLLAAMAYRAFVPNAELSDIAPYLTALELFHTFTLVHDDVMDGAKLRRGRPSLNAIYGDNMAILAGDVIHSMVYGVLARGCSRLHEDVVSLFTEMSWLLCEGQLADLKLDRHFISEAQYQDVVKSKTGAMIAGALRLGAILGGASSNDQEEIGQAGMDLGVAFQIADDACDMFSTEDELGKDVHIDAKDGKCTYPMIKYNAMTNGKAACRKTENWKIGDDMIGDVREACRNSVDEYVELSIRHLDALSINKDNLIPLRSVICVLSEKVKASFS